MFVTSGHMVIQTFGDSEMFVPYIHWLVSTSLFNPHGPNNTSSPILDRPIEHAPFTNHGSTPSHMCGTCSSIKSILWTGRKWILDHTLERKTIVYTVYGTVY